MPSYYKICIAALVVGAVASSFVHAQSVPSSITYQGKLTDASSQPVPDVPHSMQFRLFSTQTGGVPIWTSANLNVTPSAGVFTVLLDGIEASSLRLSEAWLEPSVSDVPLSRVRLASVPYALVAQQLVLPYTTTISEPGVALQIVNQKGGGVAVSMIDDATGHAGFFSVMNSSNVLPSVAVENSSVNAPALQVTSFGANSHGGFFSQSSSTGSANAVNALVLGNGAAVQANQNKSNTSAKLASTLAGVEGYQGDASYSGYFDKDVYIGGEVRVVDVNLDGKLKVPAGSPTLPIAYGHINANGTITPEATTSNVTSSLSGNIYVITIAGEVYTPTTHFASVTPIAGTARMATTFNSGGSLRVYIWNISGTGVQNAFHFQVFKR